MWLKNFLKNNSGTTALVLMLTISLGFNVYLAGRGTLFHRPQPVLKVNSPVPDSLSLQDADGKAVSVSFAEDSRPTVLYVLSPLCGWCKRNEANMKALADAAGARFRFIGLSIESKDLKKYVADRRAPFPVYFVASQDLIQKLGFFATPETIVVSPAARVEQVWQGAYLDSNAKQVEKFFDVRLPGLQELATATAAP